MSDDERWYPPIGAVDPEHPECAAVIAEVWTLLDGECTPETRDKLRHHLEECPACLRHYGVEERVKTLIAKKCSGEKAPDRLRERLRIEISRTTIIRGRYRTAFEPALGRLPWFAFECLRSRFLRPRLAMVLLSLVGGIVVQPASGGRI